MFKLLFVYGVVFLICGVSAEGVGDSCIQNGVSGICKLWSECTSATKYTIELRKLSPCEANGVESVTCCVETPAVSTKTANRSSTTESSPTEDPVDAQCDPLPADKAPKKSGRKAWDKCIEYQHKLLYPCERSVALIGGYSCVDNCKHSADTIISGGRIANTDEFPHMVQLGYTTSEKTLQESVVWCCGGVLLSDRFILTAGHCKSRSMPASNGAYIYYKVAFAAIGSLQNQQRRLYETDGSVYLIANVITKDYYPPRRYNDIALLKTTTRMSLGPTAVPACLDVFGGNRSSVIATGWGLTEGYTYPYVLQKVILKEFSEELCRQTNPKIRLMKEGINVTNQVCYGDDRDISDTSTEVIADTGTGDSGGPIVIPNPLVDCMYSVIGITSHAKFFGIRGKPAVFTRVSYYVPWIESIVWPDNPTETN